MPAKDLYHDLVKAALIQDGWTITHDPLTLIWGGESLYVDLGAEKLLAAEKAGRKIAVEIKSFLSPSVISDFGDALGQYMMYLKFLAKTEPERVLYLAIQEEIYQRIFERPMGDLFREDPTLRLAVFSVQQGVIIRWIP